MRVVCAGRRLFNAHGLWLTGARSPSGQQRLEVEVVKDNRAAGLKREGIERQG
jgi:hypothetical protein